MKRELAPPKALGLENFESFWPGQPEAIQAIKAEFERGKKAVLLDAPTGSGKSIIACYLARLLNVSTLITVRTKQLQSQYLRDFPFLASMVGRDNYQCALHPDLSASMGPCGLAGLECKNKWGVCNYYKAKKKLAEARFGLTNIFYFLYEANFVGDTSGRELLVIDEGHLLEAALMSFVGINLSRASLKRVSLLLPDLGKPKTAKAWATVVLPKLQDDAWAFRCENDLDREDVLRQLHRYLSVEQRLEALSEINPRMWLLSEGPGGCELKPVWCASFCEPNVFSHAERILLMSATFLDKNTFARQVGLDPRRVGYVQMGSNFPRENRPINFWPVQRVSRKIDNYDQMLEAIDAIIEKHPDEKGIIHTVNFMLEDLILENSRFPRRLISHGPATSGRGYSATPATSREEAIASFISSREPLVLVSPSCGIGLDLPDDLCRFQIAVKLPFLSLGDPQVHRRQREDPEWYSYACAAGLVQSLGRAIRHRDDYAVSYILDSGFDWFIKRNHYLFPSWWLEALHRIDGLDEAVLPPAMK